MLKNTNKNTTKYKQRTKWNDPRRKNGRIQGSVEGHDRQDPRNPGTRWPPTEDTTLRQPREQPGNYADLKARTIRARHRELVDRIVKGEPILDAWAAMICDPEYIREEEQNGRRDPETRPKKSSICRYHADGRVCDKGDHGCYFKHTGWPIEI